jgi:hypothetical protein
MPDLLVRWRRAWFLLRDDTDAPLPTIMGSRPRPPYQLGVWCGSNGPQQTATLVGGHLGIVAKGTDERRDFAGR